MRLGEKILESQADLHHRGDKNQALAVLLQNIETRVRNRCGMSEDVTTPTKRPADAQLEECVSPVYPQFKGKQKHKQEKHSKKQVQQQASTSSTNVRSEAPSTRVSRRASMPSISLRSETPRPLNSRAVTEHIKSPKSKGTEKSKKKGRGEHANVAKRHRSLSISGISPIERKKLSLAVHAWKRTEIKDPHLAVAMNTVGTIVWECDITDVFASLSIWLL